MTTAEPVGRRIYLAARYSRVVEMRRVRDTLQAMGHTVTSRWIDDPGVYDAGRLESDLEGCGAFAAAALADVAASDTLILFTGGGGKGGRHFEFGYAFRLGLRLVVAGPREHVFHALPQVEWHPGFAHLVAAWAPDFVADDFIRDRHADLDPNRDEAAYDDFSGDWKADR